MTAPAHTESAVPDFELGHTTALVVVDVQVGTTSNPTAHPIADVVDHVTRLVSAFRTTGLPIALASVTGTPAGATSYGAGARVYPTEWSALLPELHAQSGDILVPRRTWSAFAGTSLDAELRNRGVTDVVIVGLATSFGVESTARHAYDRGYNVVLVPEAMTDPRLEAHDGTVARVFPALGRLVDTESILTAFAAL